MAGVRRAGAGRGPRHERVTWSVAEGRRGRRWREAVAGEPGRWLALLLETDPGGRFTHLELATPAGLLTLHPEGDGTLHGNAVAADGLRHVVGLPWDADACVVVEGSTIAAAAIAHALRHVVAPGASTDRWILRIGMDLDLAGSRGGIRRLETDRWQIGDDTTVALDPEGAPLLAGGTTWPMELPEPG